MEKLKTPVAISSSTEELHSASITRMPKFDQTITIDVEVNNIYEKLLGLLPEDYKHREVLAHAIIGSSLNEGTLGYVYAPLNGYTNDIDFKVGDMVICEEPRRRDRYDANLTTSNGATKEITSDMAHQVGSADYKPKWEMRRSPIGQCKIVEINIYRTDKLKVEYQEYDYDLSKLITTSEWVGHKSCTLVPVPEPVYYAK